MKWEWSGEIQRKLDIKLEQENNKDTMQCKLEQDK